MSYPFGSIEEKWQAYWEKQKTFRTPDDRTKPKYYVLDMFPYPSGAGLHVGHPEGYTATDIVARYKRMRGFNVLHPMGWDAFGLPAERYAMKTGIHPSITTEQNIANFRRQLKALGFSYDWEREVNTTDPGYYKWTQWIFLQIFNSWYDPEARRARPISELEIPAELKKKGKQKEREEFVNKRRLAYIAEMPVNWCAELGTVLANEEVEEWTAKGYTVERKPMRQWMLRITAYAERLLDDLKHVDWPAGTLELQKNWIGRSTGASVLFKLKGHSETIEVFTTRPDTLFGVTYMVLSPEHPLVERITSKEQQAAVRKYAEETRLKSDLERQVKGEKEEKTGVFTGAYAVHPFTGQDVPVWIADYVLMGYGTGAVMAVPAHDERDYAFAQNMKLPVKVVVVPESGAAPEGEAFSAPGKNTDSDFLNGLKTPDAIERMIAELEKRGLGSRRVNYKLRDWLFSRQRYWGEPVPVSFTADGTYVAEKESKLPLVLPPSEDFQPSASGESPLAKVKDWVEYDDPKLGRMRRETNTMPQWAGSSWYYLRFIDPANKKKLASPEEEKYWMGENGVDLYVGGSEHAVLHLLYARFWHKVLYDLGVVSSVEPFGKLVHQGLILGEDGQKMSKSLGNVVNPDDVLSEFGADSFRLYEMFLGPLEMSKPWSTKAIGGVFRFLSRVWRLYTIRDTKDEDETSSIDAALDPAILKEPEGERKVRVERLTHRTIQKVTEDIEKMSFNTAISALMVFVNETTAEKEIGRFAAESFLLLLSPFAPHIAEELWQKLGHKHSLSLEPWPAFDPAKTAVDEIEIVFQVNGKVRGKAKLPPGASDDALKNAALADESVQRAIDGKELRKVIVVKNKLVNLVV